MAIRDWRSCFLPITGMGRLHSGRTYDSLRTDTPMSAPSKPVPLTTVESTETSESGAQTLTLSVGPQHSGSGHMRLIVEVDGDIIVNVAPDPGYVHRGIEKIIELRNIIKSIPVIERSSIIDASNLNHAWVRSIEEIQGVEVPQRGQYLRTLLNEMNRIMSHLYWLSIYGVFLGHTTMFMWPLGDRELFIDLAEKLTGARITYSYLVPGGVRRDLPPGFAEEAVKRTEYFEKRLKEYDRIFFNNPLFTSRAKGVGALYAGQGSMQISARTSLTRHMESSTSRFILGLTVTPILGSWSTWMRCGRAASYSG